MTNNQLAENSVIQLLNSVKLARDNAELADNRVDHSFYYALTIALEELQERRKADSEPVAEVVSIYGDPESFGEREIRPLVGIQQMPYGTKLYRHAQPAPVYLTEAQVAALEEEERSFHDAIRKCIASLRYHHKRAEAHLAGYKCSTLDDDTLKSINFLKRNITAAMLNGGKS